MRNRHFQVKLMKDPEISGESDVQIDPEELSESIIRNAAVYITAAMCTYKGVSTLLRCFEHIVVTKVK